MNNRVLITGASGYVGSYIYAFLKDLDLDVVGTYNSNQLFSELIKIDISSPESVREVVRHVDPHIIVHTAGEPRSRFCEDNPSVANELNVNGTKNIVEIAKEKGIKVIFLSTFGCYNKLNVYSKSKLDGENLVSELANYVILRCSIVFGISPNSTTDNFFNSLRRSISKKEKIVADSSWNFNFTCMKHLAEIVQRCCENSEINKVMIPVFSEGITNKYEVAKKIAMQFGIEVEEINDQKNLAIPLPDVSAYNKFQLPKCTTDKCLEELIQEL